MPFSANMALKTSSGGLVTRDWYLEAEREKAEAEEDLFLSSGGTNLSKMEWGDRKEGSRGKPREPGRPRGAPVRNLQRRGRYGDAKRPEEDG
jgi:hypothetical protein